MESVRPKVGKLRLLLLGLGRVPVLLLLTHLSPLDSEDMTGRCGFSVGRCRRWLVLLAVLGRLALLWCW